jgi:heat shock protein HtpX
MWEQIRANQIRSWVMIILLGLIMITLGWSLGFWLLDNEIFGVLIALVVFFGLFLIALFKGDDIILYTSGAHKITPQDFPRLFNIVEEMKITSCLEYTPQMYIIDDSAINAFAVGRDTERASIIVTAGLLEKLDRSELQGVIAHEISHLKNRDVQFLVFAGILLGSILILSKYSIGFIFFGGRGRRFLRIPGAWQWLLIGLGIVLIVLTPIVSQLIYFAISRKREYLADASSALYTRYPEGLASALEKIQTNRHRVLRADKATAPMYISNPFETIGKPVNALYSTHPPLRERINILRSMSGVSLADYDKSFLQLKGKRVIPFYSLAMTENETIEKQVAATESENIRDKIARRRETSRFFWKVGNYQTIDCARCGNRLRLPPSYSNPTIRCFYCGNINEVITSLPDK